MIYPSRIKGEEYPLRKGDIVVCITESFQEFTYGRQYRRIICINCDRDQKLNKVLENE